MVLVQTSGASKPGRGRNGRQVELCVTGEDLWVSLPEGEGCAIQVVMSAKRLEEGLGLAAGQLPQSLVDGKELVLVLVRCPHVLLEPPKSCLYLVACSCTGEIDVLNFRPNPPESCRVHPRLPVYHRHPCPILQLEYDLL